MPELYENETKIDEVLPEGTNKPSAYSAFSLVTDAQGNILPTSALSRFGQTTGTFGGNGSDGDLIISSGTTTIDLGGLKYFLKNYSAISITGTGKLAFSNPHANGTKIVLKSTGDVVLTSSTAPMIDVSGMGAIYGGAVSGISNGVDGTNGFGLFEVANQYGRKGLSGNEQGGVGGVAISIKDYFATVDNSALVAKIAALWTGAGGGSGGSGTGGTSGVGGRGGGALYIECGGYLNFPTALGISVSGTDGTAGAVMAGGGGGGACGSCIILYNNSTAATGTVKATGGNGGAGYGADNSASGGGGASAITTLNNTSQQGVSAGGSGGETAPDGNGGGGGAPGAIGNRNGHNGGANLSTASLILRNDWFG